MKDSKIVLTRFEEIESWDVVYYTGVIWLSNENYLDIFFDF